MESRPRHWLWGLLVLLLTRSVFSRRVVGSADPPKGLWIVSLRQIRDGKPHLVGIATVSMENAQFGSFMGQVGEVFAETILSPSVPEFRQGFGVCNRQTEEYFVLAPDIALQLNGTDRYGAGFCVLLHVQYRSRRNLGEMLQLFSWEERESVLMNLETIMVSALGNYEGAVSDVNSGAAFRHATDLFQDATLRNKLSRDETKEMREEVSVDANRFHAFSDPNMRMPQDVTVEQAKEMVVTVLHRRLGQKLKYKGCMMCPVEKYFQSHYSVAASLVVLTLEAAAELEELILEGVKDSASRFDPLSVAYSLFAKYADSMVAAFHDPWMLKENITSEMTQVFGDYYLIADDLARDLIDAMAIKWYGTLCSTASNTLSSTASSRFFWTLFFNTVNIAADRSVAFYRGVLIAAWTTLEVPHPDSGTRLTFPGWQTLEAPKDRSFNNTELLISFKKRLDAEMKLVSTAKQALVTAYHCLAKQPQIEKCYSDVPSALAPLPPSTKPRFTIFGWKFGGP